MLKIGLAQLLVEPGNARENVTRMKEYIREAVTKNCDLIIFPELCIPGYFIGDNWDQSDYMNECISLGEEIRTLSENITVIFGNVALEKGKINPDGRIRKYNAMFIAQNGKFIAPGRSPYPFYIKPSYPTTESLMIFAILPLLPRWLRNATLFRKTFCHRFI